MVKKLRFVGDVWFSRVSPKPPEWLNKETVINLETPIASNLFPNPRKICLSITPADFDAVFETAPVAACLANNHIMDHGAEAFSETIQHLESRGIRYFGAGTLKERCGNPLMLNIDGISVALMGYVCPSTHGIFATDTNVGVAPIELRRIKEDVHYARSLGASRIIVTLHWGDEEVGIPKPMDIEIAQGLIELGIDLVIGHHPHCRQPVYSAGEQHIFFSVGNAMFSDFEYKMSDGGIAWAKQRFWNNLGIAVDYAPVTRYVQAKMLAQTAGAAFIGRFFSRITYWHKLPCPHDPKYLKKYLNAKRLSYIRLLASRIIAKPKLPRLKSLKYTISSLIAK